MNCSTLRPTSFELLICGMTLLFIPLMSLLLSTIAFLSGGCITAWTFPAAVIAALVLGHFYMYRCKSGNHAITRYYLYTILALTLSLLSSTIIYDYSYDGNTYHQGAIVGLINGWNPFYNPSQTGALWETHYAKAMEIVAASIAMTTHRIESGKAVNLLLIVSSIFITYYFLRHELPRLRCRKILMLTILLTSCPIVVLQSHTYYNDYTLYTLMLLSIIALIHIIRRKGSRLWWYLLIASVLIGTVTKFTIAFYLYLTLAIAIIWTYITRERTLSRRLFFTSAALFVIGFGIIGFHPYITNTIGWGNPFYPLIGGNIDIMTSNTPELYQDGNRITNWVRSLFFNAEGHGIWVPFINDSLHDYYIAYDARIAGLGAFFGYALIISIALFISTTCHKQLSNEANGHRRAAAIISTLLIAGCFIFEQSWWMRYVPFLWAAPIVLLIGTEYIRHLPRPLHAIRNIVYTMLTTTILLCCATSFIGGFAFTQRLGAIYHAITPQSTVEMYSYGNIVSFEHKLHERDITFRRLKKGELPTDTTLICVPFPNKALIYLDAETHSHLPQPDLMDFMLSNK